MLSHPEYRRALLGGGEATANGRTEQVSVLQTLADLALQEKSREGVMAQALNNSRASSAKSQDALQREVEYQKSRAKEIQISATPDYIFERYRKCKLWRFIEKEYMFKALGDVRGKTVLDFGCGEGRISTQLAALGAAVTGVDISTELISLARKRSDLDKVADRTDFQAVDLLQKPPSESSFDFVFCSDALHHVNLYAVLPALRQCLRPGGRIIVGEPVALSRTLAKLRDLIPIRIDASPDDRNLNQADLDYITSQFSNGEFTYFNLLARLTRFIPSANKIDTGHPFAKAVVILIAMIDRLLAAVPGLRRLYGAVVFVGEKPDLA